MVTNLIQANPLRTPQETLRQQQPMGTAPAKIPKAKQMNPLPTPTAAQRKKAATTDASLAKGRLDLAKKSATNVENFALGLTAANAAQAKQEQDAANRANLLAANVDKTRKSLADVKGLSSMEILNRVFNGGELGIKKHTIAARNALNLYNFTVTQDARQRALSDRNLVRAQNKFSLKQSVLNAKDKTLIEMQKTRTSQAATQEQQFKDTIAIRSDTRATVSSNLSAIASQQRNRDKQIKDTIGGLTADQLKAFSAMADQNPTVPLNIGGVPVPGGFIQTAWAKLRTQQVTAQTAVLTLNAKQTEASNQLYKQIVDSMDSSQLTQVKERGYQTATGKKNQDGTPETLQLPADGVNKALIARLKQESDTASQTASQTGLGTLINTQQTFVDSVNQYQQRVGPNSSPVAKQLFADAKNLHDRTQLYSSGGNITPAHVQELAARTQAIQTQYNKVVTDTVKRYSNDPAIRSVFDAYMHGTPVSSVDATSVLLKQISTGAFNWNATTPQGKAFNTALQGELLKFGVVHGVDGVTDNSSGKLTPTELNQMILNVVQAGSQGFKSSKLMDLAQFGSIIQQATANSLVPRVKAMLFNAFDPHADGTTALTPFQLETASNAAEAAFKKLPPDQQKGQQGNLTDAVLFLEELRKHTINGKPGDEVFLKQIQESKYTATLQKSADPGSASNLNGFLRASAGVGKDNLHQYGKQLGYYKAAERQMNQRTDTALQDIVKSFDDPAKYNESLVKLAAIEQTSPQLYTKLIDMIKADPSLSFKTINATATEFLQKENASKVTEQAIHDKLASAWELMKKAALWMPEYQRKIHAHRAFQKTKDAIKQGKY